MWRMYVYAGAGGFLGTGLPLTKCAGSLGPDHFLLSGVGNPTKDGGENTSRLDIRRLRRRFAVLSAAALRAAALQFAAVA